MGDSERRSSSSVPRASTKKRPGSVVGARTVLTIPTEDVYLATRVLRRIEEAQDKGIFAPGARKNRVNPPFEIACEEVRRGCKKTHLIWYVWPSWSAVRSTSKPDLLLPNFNAACLYL